MIKIKSRWTGAILFSGEVASLKEATQEAIKKGADLVGADLVGADLVGADLVGANLGGADLVGADLVGGIKIKQAPIQVAGLTWLITIWDAHMQIGCEFHSHDDWRGFDDAKWLEMGGQNALKLKQELLTTLLALCDSHAKKAL